MTTQKKVTLGLIMCAVMMSCTSAKKPASSQFTVESSLDIAEVPSQFPVGFCLLTEGKRQYVAYFDKDRNMTVASRTLDSKEWSYQILPSKVGWDSHNNIKMALDGDGHLHVSGNMHCVPLVYFRTEKPGDVTTLKAAAMTGDKEVRVTYPKFMTDPAGNFLFNYRSGKSGRGIRLWNKYDLKTRAWSRLLDKPVLDGETMRNAYPRGPTPGPDGWMYLIWVWRDDIDCATNHDLSCARTKDLINWESAFGKKIKLPITLDMKSLLVDPVPSGGGIINGCANLFFDSSDRPVISYHKSDTNGNMQIYAARAEGTEWVRYVLTDWQKPVKFGGWGSMPFIGISVSRLSQHEPGVLTMTYRHRDYGEGRLVIDEETLRPLDKTITITPMYPAELTQVQSDFEGMQIRRSVDIGASPEKDTRYILQWETLSANHDHPREPPFPAPSMLKLYKLSTTD